MTVCVPCSIIYTCTHPFHFVFQDIIHISSELALFTAMTSCSDCHIRLHVLHQMTTFSKHVPELRLEVQSALIGLKETMNDAAAMELMHYWTTQTGGMWVYFAIGFSFCKIIYFCFATLM